MFYWLLRKAGIKKNCISHTLFTNYFMKSVKLICCLLYKFNVIRWRCNNTFVFVFFFFFCYLLIIIEDLYHDTDLSYLQIVLINAAKRRHVRYFPCLCLINYSNNLYWPGYFTFNFYSRFMIYIKIFYRTIFCMFSISISTI